MIFTNVPLDPKTAKRLAAIKDPVDRLAEAGELVLTARAEVAERRDTRNVSLLVLHLRHGWSQARCYRDTADMDRWTFQEALDRLPAVMRVDLWASAQYTRVLRADPDGPDTMARPVSIAEDLTVYEGTGVAVRGLRADSGIKRKTRLAIPRVDAKRPLVTWSNTIAPDETIRLEYLVDVPSAPAALVMSPGLAARKITSRAADKTGPGDKAYFRIEARSTATTGGEEKMTFSEDIGHLLEDATFNQDAVASHGRVVVTGNQIAWSGRLRPGQIVSVIYSVTRDGEGGAAQPPLPEVDGPGVAVSGDRMDVIAFYQRLLAVPGDDLVRMYLHLLDLGADEVAAIARSKADGFRAWMSVWKTAAQVRDEVALELMNGEHGPPMSNADVGRVGRLKTSAVAELRTRVKPPEKVA
jgi:hypothetical protein